MRLTMASLKGVYQGIRLPKRQIFLWSWILGTKPCSAKFWSWSWLHTTKTFVVIATTKTPYCIVWRSYCNKNVIPSRFTSDSHKLIFVWFFCRLHVLKYSLPLLSRWNTEEFVGVNISWVQLRTNKLLV